MRIALFNNVSTGVNVNSTYILSDEFGTHGVKRLKRQTRVQIEWALQSQQVSGQSQSE